MGASSSNEDNKVFSFNKTKCIITGLDATGKTSILYHLKVGENITYKKLSNGFLIRNLQCKNFNAIIFDLGGEDLILNRVRSEFKNVHGIIFVVDSDDIYRIDDAKHELENLLKEEKLRDSILLVLANKQDLPRSIKPNELANRLNLQSITDREYHIQGTSAKTGDGILESLKWFNEHICMKFK